MVEVKINLNKDEEDLLRAISEYMKKTGAIDDSSLESLFRYACFKLLVPLVIKDIEADRG